jgi:hypothetical protein
MTLPIASTCARCRVQIETDAIAKLSAKDFVEKTWVELLFCDDVASNALVLIDQSK